MRQINQILQQQAPANQPIGSEKMIFRGDRRATPQDMALVNFLFEQLFAAFPAWKAAFTSAESVATAKRLWFNALIDAGVTEQAALERGINRCITSRKPFLPAVGEFIDWCKPSPAELGLPDASAAWLEICNKVRGRQYSHGIVLAVRKDPRIDVWNLSKLPVDQSLKTFEPVYAEYVERTAAGEKFELPELIEDKNSESRPRSAETKHRAFDLIASLRQSLKTGELS